jgi:signal transduction histidine kinase
MPHAVCWRADPRLIWTMVITNLITFLSYLSICLTLFFMVRQTRRVIARDWAYFLVGFALFIVACGSTHLMEVVTTWLPFFWIDAATNIVTAALSAYVAINLARRARVIGFSVNDYAERLIGAESEKERLRESLLAAQKLEEWSRMSTVVAHEIANPLEAIGNLLYLIRESNGVTGEISALAGTAADEADRVLTIARSALSFFRHSNAPEMVDIAAAAASLRVLLAPVFADKRIEFVLEIDGDATVEAFPGEVRQVLLNLVRNACEASPGTGSKVTVRLQGAKDSVDVAVADEGCGIDAEMLPSLFQFGMSTKGELGNGMGLWTVKHIVERHGGAVKVKSEPGSGTTFALHWPRAFAREHEIELALTH